MKLTKEMRKIMIDIYGPKEKMDRLDIPAIIRQQEHEAEQGEKAQLHALEEARRLK